MAFFNVGTIKAWETRYGRICSDTLFRTSQAFESDDGAVLMWLRSGELGADLDPRAPGTLETYKTGCQKFVSSRKLSDPNCSYPSSGNSARQQAWLLVKRAPRGCRASGASRMVAPDKVMILLSFRGLSDDTFWFTVFHEIGHLVLHSAQTFVDVDMEELNDNEREANGFASRCIIAKTENRNLNGSSPIWMLWSASASRLEYRRA